VILNGHPIYDRLLMIVDHAKQPEREWKIRYRNRRDTDKYENKGY